jgi:hypothetical protein
MNTSPTTSSSPPPTTVGQKPALPTRITAPTSAGRGGAAPGARLGSAGPRLPVAGIAGCEVTGA